jgi:hypothetical protein
VITVVEVATHLGVPADPRMEAATQAAVSWVQQRRFRLPPTVLWADPAVRLGAILYAGCLYNRRAAPMGSDSYADDMGESGYVMTEIYRLIPADPVVA